MEAGEASGLPPIGDITNPEGAPALPPAKTSSFEIDNNVMAGVAFGLLIPVLLAVMFNKGSKKPKVRAVTCEAGGEPGLTKRNQRFLGLVETPWEGADTLAFLFEQACQKYAHNNFVGTRELIKRETETSSDGKSFEKVTLGKYKWLTYGEALIRVENFASGLVALGHRKGERVAIFAETRAELLLALQVFQIFICFSWHNLGYKDYMMTKGNFN